MRGSLIDWIIKQASRDDEVHTPPSPTRKSSRLRKQLASDALADDYIDKDLDDGDDNATIKKPKSIVSSELLKIDYDSFPEVSEGLDDFEFKTYVFLRAWRAKKCKELDLEAYKLFQNKTLCELIRRRRNDVTWAKDDMNDFEKIAKDLRECWGIGPSKVKYMLDSLVVKHCNFTTNKKKPFSGNSNNPVFRLFPLDLNSVTKQYIPRILNTAISTPPLFGL